MNLERAVGGAAVTVHARCTCPQVAIHDMPNPACRCQLPALPAQQHDVDPYIHCKTMVLMASLLCSPWVCGCSEVQVEVKALQTDSAIQSVDCHTPAIPAYYEVTQRIDKVGGSMSPDTASSGGRPLDGCHSVLVTSRPSDAKPSLRGSLAGARNDDHATEVSSMETGSRIASTLCSRSVNDLQVGAEHAAPTIDDSSKRHRN